jgi:hypothetical protein
MAFVLLLAAVSVQAGPPLNGVYQSNPENTGQVLNGRFSEAWIGGGQGQVNNTVHGASWDGTALAAQWELLCPWLQYVPTMIKNTIVNGTGQMVWYSIYYGGTIWLTGAAAWGGGDVDYDVDLEFYTHTTTMTYNQGNLVSYVTNVVCRGFFIGYPSCMEMTIANAASMGMGGVPPSDYPVLKDYSTGCADAVGYVGEWGVVHSITVVITGCEVGVHEGTWGSIKSLYR